MLKKAIDKYIADKNPDRLSAILISNKLKPTKQNINAFKVLLADYEEEQDLNPINSFLGLDNKTELAPIELEEIEPNEDDFIITVKQAFGNPEDPNSLGNKILRQEVIKFNVRSYINPDVLFNRFCALTGRSPISIDFHPMSLNGIPVWECCISGMATIERMRKHKID